MNMVNGFAAHKLYEILKEGCLIYTADLEVSVFQKAHLQSEK